VKKSQYIVVGIYREKEQLMYQQQEKGVNQNSLHTSFGKHKWRAKKSEQNVTICEET